MAANQCWLCFCKYDFLYVYVIVYADGFVNHCFQMYRAAALFDFVNSCFVFFFSIAFSY